MLPPGFNGVPSLHSNLSDVFHKGAHHQSMYDASYLAAAFRKAGFSCPEQKKFAQSQIPNIGSVELESRSDERLYMEALKN
jgi:hypothetical protein